MNYYKLNLQGKRHIYETRPCEDAVAISRDKDVFVLADGVTNCAKGGLGAEKRAKSMVSWLEDPAVKKVLEKASAAEVRSLVTTALRHIDTCLCEMNPGSKADDFASTFLAAVRVGNMMCLLHAGDGVIFGCPNTQQTSVTVISGPDNAPSGAVYHSSHVDQVKRMRVMRVMMNDYKSIILSTDGFSDAYLKPYVNNLDLLERLLASEDTATFEQLSEEDHERITDDISCIVIDTAEQVSAPRINKKESSRKDAAAVQKSTEVGVFEEPPAKSGETPKLSANSALSLKQRRPGAFKTVAAAVLVVLLIAAETTALALLTKKTSRLEADMADIKSQVVRYESFRRTTEKNRISTDS